MPKVNDYKQYDVYATNADGEKTEYSGMKDALLKFWASENTTLCARFVLKRRQNVETWKNQFDKAVSAYEEEIRQGMKKAGMKVPKVLFVDGGCVPRHEDGEEVVYMTLFSKDAVKRMAEADD